MPVPPIGFGGTYRGIRFGANLNPDMIVGVEAGVTIGPIGLSMPIITFSLSDYSFAFVPDYNPELSLDLNAYRSVTWSARDGFGRELGLKFPTLKGRFIYDLEMQELTKSALRSPSSVGELSFDGGQWTFTLPVSSVPGSTLLGRAQQSDFLTLPSATTRWRSGSIAEATREDVTHPHVIRVRWTGHWVPEKGYTWLDGTSSFRDGDQDLAVRWNVGEISPFPPHLRAAGREGFWEPSDQSRSLQPFSGILASPQQIIRMSCRRSKRATGFRDLAISGRRVKPPISVFD